MKYHPIKNILAGVLLLLLANHSPAQQNAIPSVKADSLVSIYKNANGLMVVNFWSTWCKPCIEEIPHFISVIRNMKDENVQLLLVSQDTKSLYESGKLKKYLINKKWNNERVLWLNETNADYYCPLIDSSWSGVIPATLIIYPAKNYYHFYEESLSAEALKTAIKKATGK